MFLLYIKLNIILNKILCSNKIFYILSDVNVFNIIQLNISTKNQTKYFSKNQSTLYRAAFCTVFLWSELDSVSSTRLVRAFSSSKNVLKRKRERKTGPSYGVSTEVCVLRLAGKEEILERDLADGARLVRVRQEAVWCKQASLYACSQPRDGPRLDWRRRRAAISMRNVRTRIQVAVISHATLQIRVRPLRFPVYLHLHPLRQVLLSAGSSQAAHPQHPRECRRQITAVVSHLRQRVERIRSPIVFWRPIRRKDSLKLLRKIVTVICRNLQGCIFIRWERNFIFL